MKNRCKFKPNIRSESEMRYVSGFGASLSAGLLLRFGTERTELGYGITVLYRIRAGQYWTASRLAKAGMIASDFERHCPFCPVPRAAPPETVTHWILSCPAWEEQRKETIGAIREYGTHREAGMTDNAKKFVCAIAGLDPNEMLGIPLIQMGNWMESWLCTADKEWNEEVVEKLTLFIGRTAHARFRQLTFTDPGSGGG